MRTRTRTAASTLAATLAVLPLVAGPVQAGHAERAALTGSIVYIKDHDVWLMSPDGVTKRQLTTDGSAASAYINHHLRDGHLRGSRPRRARRGRRRVRGVRRGGRRRQPGRRWRRGAARVLVLGGREHAAHRLVLRHLRASGPRRAAAVGELPAPGSWRDLPSGRVVRGRLERLRRLPLAVADGGGPGVQLPVDGRGVRRGPRGHGPGHDERPAARGADPRVPRARPARPTQRLLVVPGRQHDRVRRPASTRTGRRTRS